MNGLFSGNTGGGGGNGLFGNNNKGIKKNKK